MKNGEVPSKISPTTQTSISSTVIYANKNFILVKDQKPRASVHLLLLPRDKSKYELHPLDAYSDPIFRAKVQTKINVAKKIAATHLKKLYEKTASTDRDWEAEIRTGCHVAPSMNHLHIHIISTDFCNSTAKSWAGREYLAMGTEFFTALDQLPLPSNDPRQKRDKRLLDSGELVCWRCGKNFGQQTNWAVFKKQLDEEEAWKEL
jgi:aprataxin